MPKTLFGKAVAHFICGVCMAVVGGTILTMVDDYKSGYMEETLKKYRKEHEENAERICEDRD